jgi:hypothetical protein
MCFIIPTLNYGREKIPIALAAASFIPMVKEMIVTLKERERFADSGPKNIDYGTDPF